MTRINEYPLFTYTGIPLIVLSGILVGLVVFDAIPDNSDEIALVAGSAMSLYGLGAALGDRLAHTEN